MKLPLFLFISCWTYIIGQRMHQQQLIDLPLQRFFQMSSPLSNYIPQANNDSFFTDLPLQPISNPFGHRTNNSNRIPTAASANSLSKWAFTEMSTQDHKQEEFFPPHFCQSPKQEIVTEATFKPHQLKEELRMAKASSSKKDRQSQAKESHNKGLKEILCNTLLNTRAQEIRKKQQRVTTTKREDSKTKYQKLLEQFYNKPKNTRISKPSFQEIPDMKVRYGQTRLPDENIVSYRAHDKQNVPALVNWTRSQSLKNIQSQREQVKPLKRINCDEPPKKYAKGSGTGLTKTFSQPSLTQRGRISSSDETRGARVKAGEQGWMKMSFGQRQKKTLQNRRQIAKEGKQINEEKQVQGCTFKPHINEYRGRGREQTASSYAKLYMEKIRGRV